MSLVLPHLQTKEEVDYVLRNVQDMLVVLRFGRDDDIGCIQLDDTVGIFFISHLYLGY